MASIPTIALSAHWHTHPERFEWIEAHGFAAEYTPNPEAFERLPAHVDPLLEAGIPVRYHGFFPRHEFGHADAAAAERAVEVHLASLEALQGRGEQFITLHCGLNPDIPLDLSRAVTNLSRLAQRACDLGITVSLENLRRGPTSDPETVVAWASESGAMITLDVGHAVSCRRVQDGESTVIDFIAAFTGRRNAADRLREVHMYERETDHHHAPRDMRALGPIVDRLMETDCRWWTIELDDPDEALATRTLLIDYLEARPSLGAAASNPVQ